MPLIESRPTSPARVGRMALTAVFIAVALMMGAKWFVAWDYQSISVGDSVSALHGGPHGNQNQVTDITNGIATIEDVNGVIYKAPLNELTEL